VLRKGGRKSGGESTALAKVVSQIKSRGGAHACGLRRFWAQTRILVVRIGCRLV
jgi:hypothetical protein